MDAITVHAQVQHNLTSPVGQKNNQLPSNLLEFQIPKWHSQPAVI